MYGWVATRSRPSTFDATGVDLAECVVRQLVGEKVLADIRAVLDEERPAQCSAIWFVAAPVAGVLADVSGLDEAGNTEGVTEVKLLVDPGSTIGPLESSDSRVAYVRAVGETADLAVNAARKAAAHLEFPVAGARGQRADGVTAPASRGAIAGYCDGSGWHAGRPPSPENRWCSAPTRGAWSTCGRSTLGRCLWLPAVRHPRGRGSPCQRRHRTLSSAVSGCAGGDEVTAVNYRTPSRSRSVICSGLRPSRSW